MIEIIREKVYMSEGIDHFFIDAEREPLKHPFGFKGGYLDELWQISCRVRAADKGGIEGRGKGVQSVLWADADVFAKHSGTGANALMLAVTEKALCLLRNRPFDNPQTLFHEIFPECLAYAAKITEKPDLQATFVLNALVPVDFALWQLWAAREGVTDFGELAGRFAPSMRCRHEKLGLIPLLSYDTETREIERLLEEGAFFLKIKIGSNPGGRNSKAEMIRADLERLRQIHELARRYRTDYTDCGRPLYYLDANGRYDNPEQLNLFLKGAADMGALERIAILEEPFPEDKAFSVRNLPVRVAGDESIHSREDAKRRLDELGYGAVALKPIAKTLSATLEIYEEAAKRGIPCFCADLTVPPDLFEWNAQVAARIGAIPGVKIGVIETNGAQNYRNWDALLRRTGHPDAAWFHPVNGVIDLKDFYQNCSVLH